MCVWGGEGRGVVDHYNSKIRLGLPVKPKSNLDSVELSIAPSGYYMPSHPTLRGHLDSARLAYASNSA